MRGSDLESHIGNWREHPIGQAQVLAGVLKEIGIADALLAWRSERNGGKLTTFDGHLRKEIAPDSEWPVLVTDLTDAEADAMLAVHDPIAGMASTDAGALDALLSSVHYEDRAVQSMLDEMMAGIGKIDDSVEPSTAPRMLLERWAVLIECESEQDQAALLTRFDSEGLKCRALIS